MRKGFFKSSHNDCYPNHQLIRGAMVICPIANTVGCNKCAMVNFCFVKTVLGNYGQEQPGDNSEEAKSTEAESKPPE